MVFVRFSKVGVGTIGAYGRTHWLIAHYQAEGRGAHIFSNEKSMFRRTFSNESRVFERFFPNELLELLRFHWRWKSSKMKDNEFNDWFFGLKVSSQSFLAKALNTVKKTDKEADTS